MAEKSHIKKSDDILSSIDRGKAKKTGVNVQEPPFPMGDDFVADEFRDDGDDGLDFKKYKLPGSRRKKVRKDAYIEEEEEAVDPMAVELVGADEEPEVLAPLPAKKEARPEPRPMEWEVLSSLPEEPPPLAPKAREEAPVPPPAPGQPVMAKVVQDASRVQEFDFADLGAEKEAEEAAEADRIAKEEAARQARLEREAAEEKARLEREAAREQARLEEEQRRRVQEEQELARQEAARLEKEAETRRKLLEDEQYREDVFKKMGSQFEEAFNLEFEDKPLEEKPLPKWLIERRDEENKRKKSQAEPLTAEEEFELDGDVLPEPVAQAPTPVPEEIQAAAPVIRLEPEPQTASDPVLPEEPHSEAEQVQEPRVQTFTPAFGEETAPARNQETGEPDFKETLAEKFMRERERYLADLGIAERVEEAQRLEQEREQEMRRAKLVEPPARRKLDFQIQPEMHMQAGETPPQPPVQRPVTYTRQAALHPQQPDKADPKEPAIKPAIPFPATPAATFESAAEKKPGTKSAEQLLLELGKQTKQKARVQAGAGKAPSELKFTFSTPEEAQKEQAKRKRKKLFSGSNKKIILVSGVSALLVLSLVFSGVFMLVQRNNMALDPDDSYAAMPGGDLLEAYEDYNFQAQAMYNNVVVKRSGLTFSNLTVQESLIVEEEAMSSGGLTLSNVMVGEMIYIKSSGVNTLNLQDVHAQRLVINNDNSPVTIHVNGATDIATVELRTPAAVQLGQLTEDARGLGPVLLQNKDGAQPLSLDLHNVKLEAVSAQGQSLLTLDGATVEKFTADGPFVLGGTGKVENLFAGYNLGGGSSDVAVPADKAMAAQIKGVDVGHLDIKSAADIQVDGTVDTAAAADSLTLRGKGSIGTLTLNEKAGIKRIGAALQDINIKQLITNAEAVIDSTGGATINVLIANRATYTLGNKVNHLKANAEGIIYEKEPDLKTIAPGITPPQSKADNPNLNYSLATITTEVTLGAGDVADDGISTTCGHARQVGGFIQGDGSKDNPFVVATPAQLAHVGQHLGSHYVQAGDIDIADDSAYAGGFPMIAGRFFGSYDGGGHTIANLRILADGENIGLFAENTGVIKNVHILSGEINGGSRAFVGGIVGFNYQGGTVESSSNGAIVSALQSTYSGGIVGYNYGGKVRDCYNTAKVDGGTVVGGVVGMNKPGSGPASVAGCYNIGVVAGTGSVGGVVGSNEDAVVTNCYYLESSAAQGIGDGDGSAVAKTSQGLASAQAAADLAAGSDQSQWQPGSGGYPYPVLGTEGASTVSSSRGVSFADDLDSPPEDDLLDAADDEHDTLADEDQSPQVSQQESDVEDILGFPEIIEDDWEPGFQ